MYSSIIRRLSCNKLLNSIKLNYCTQISNDFTPIYLFPYIRATGLINRLKMYQTALTITSVPASIVLCNFGVINPDSVITTFVLGLTGTLTLLICGILPTKFVGYVYLKHDNSTVRISYLDFWGRRKNRDLPLKDMVPLSDLPAIPTDPIYLTLRRFSEPETFKINLKYGVVLDKSKFNYVFLQDI